MAILDLKSNLSQWRKPTTVESGEKKKLSESPIKAVYSTSNEFKTSTDIKINKVDNSTSIQVPGAKKIDYKLFSINGKRNRGIPAISTLFGDKLLPKVSEYKEQRVKELVKASEFIKITPRGIQHISTIEILKTILKDKISKYKDQFPRNLTKTSLYKDQLPIDILKLSLYKDQLPAIIDKLSLYKDQIPALLDKLSLYKDQLPRLLSKLSLYKDQRPNMLAKISQYIQKLIDNKNSIYDTRKEILGFKNVSDRLRLLYRATYPPVFNYFNDLQSGAKGFTRSQTVTQYLGLDTNALTYTYPKTVREGRLSDSTKIKGAQQWPLKVTFSNRLGNTKYTRTVYNSNKPYTSAIGITGDTLEKYFFRTNSPSARDILYSAFNLRDSSFNTGLALFNQPLILTGIQRKDFVKTGFYPWETWKFDDGFIRGGVVTSTQRAIVDVLRIGKWMASVKGLLFITRQAGLQASAPNTEADPFVGKRAGNGALTLISSLANTATQHLGLRFRKDAVPFVPRTTYSVSLISNNSINDSGQFISTPSWNPTSYLSPVGNRLLKLKDEYFDTSVRTERNGISKVLSRLGGSQSVYGIGTTNIKRTLVSNEYRITNNFGVSEVYNKNTNTRISPYSTLPYESMVNSTSTGILSDLYSTLAGNSTFMDVQRPIINGVFNFKGAGRRLNGEYTKATNTSDNYYTLGYNDIIEKAKTSDLNTTKITNFLLNDDAKKVKWIPTQGAFEGSVVIQDYTQTSQHIRKKLRVPEYGKRGKNLQNPLKGDFMSKYTPGGNGMIDPIWKINQTDEEAVDDFIKFMFHDLNTNERFRFRAYIENVSEDFSPSWQEVKILGRADSPYIYQGFERSLSISFKAAALSRGDLMLMWDQLERLAKTTVPKYDNTYKMKGPLIKFTLGNWFINTPAFIKSLSYTVDNETPWEINLSDTGIYRGENKEYNVGELPMIVSVQVSMQIFGEVRPASTHTQAEPGGITSSTHYGAGHLYPLGINKLRTKRQTALLGNDNLADPEDEVVTTIAARPLTPIDVNLPELTGPSAPAPRR
jgi:hypothetical protein